MPNIKGLWPFLTVLAGCVSTPEYQAPAIPETASGAFINAGETTDSQQVVPQQWWQLYQDASLNSLVEMALSANTSIRVAQANLASAYAIYRNTNSQRLPATDISANPRYVREPNPWGEGGEKWQWSYSAGINVSYELDFTDRVNQSVRASQADMQASQASLDAVRLAVVAETTRAYVDSCSLAESINVAETSIELSAQRLELVENREAAGAASRLDVERAAAIYANAQSALPPLQAQRENSLLELAALVGVTPNEIPSEARQCQQPPRLKSIIPVGDGESLLRRRPDVRIAERQLAADTARIGIAISQLYPQITLGASASYNDNPNLEGDEGWSYGIGPLISWYFPNQQAVRAQLEQAEARSEASLANFDETVLNALKETEQALANYNAMLRQNAALTDARDASRRAYELAQLQYDAGAISFLDTLVAQTSLIESESALINNQQQLGSLSVSVFLALGGGWESQQTN